MEVFSLKIIFISRFLKIIITIVCLLCLNLTSKSQCTKSSINDGFENPLVAGGFQLINDNAVPGWSTTATDNLIEIWHTGFWDVPAYQGNQFAELNATQVSTLYQDLSIPSGEIVQIHFAHRGRDGVDVMSLKAGAPGGPYTTIGTYSDGNLSWGYYSGITYTVPIGQNTTRFLFEPVSSAGGASQGNFIDDIAFIYPEISILLSSENPCNGSQNGNALATPIGGQAPYKFLWNNGQNISSISGLSAGNYIVTITDANDCTATDSITLIEQEALSDTIYQTQKINCNGSNNGAVTVIPSGGTTPYKYLWSSGENTSVITNLAAGTYKVTITDSLLCTKIDSIIISEPAVLFLDTKIIDANCSNRQGAASVTVSGGTTPYSYLWNDSLSQNTATAFNLSSGNYTVIVTDINGCTAISGDVVISDIKTPLTLFTPTPVEGESPLEVVFTNMSDRAISYQWDFGNGTSSTSDAPTIRVVYEQPGSYEISLKAISASGCSDTMMYRFIKVSSFSSSLLTPPNVFTPNADGVNDIFKLKTKNIASLSVIIFSRWGNKVNEWNNVAGAWDGTTTSGNAAPDGVYYYIINAIGLDGVNYEKKGFLTLLR